MTVVLTSPSWVVSFLLKRWLVLQSRENRISIPDRTPRNYDRNLFTLDGRIDLDVMFNDQEMCMPVYVKADAHEQSLLSEGVCRQLWILQYHADVESWRGGKK